MNTKDYPTKTVAILISIIIITLLVIVTILTTDICFANECKSVNEAIRHNRASNMSENMQSFKINISEDLITISQGNQSVDLNISQLCKK